MYVVIIVAENVNAQPRKIAQSFPHRSLMMRLTKLDEQTGEFSAEAA
jgi:hypothetical protein